MGSSPSYVKFDDAPSDLNGTTPDTLEAEFSEAAFLIGEFSRSTGEPDVDIYDTGELTNGENYTIAIYPSFFVFEEIYDVGDVTIEVLDNTGSVYPSIELGLSEGAAALAAIHFQADRDGNFFYRLTPSSGTNFGEYMLVQYGESEITAFSGPPIVAGGARRLQTASSLAENYQDTINLFAVYDQNIAEDRVDRVVVNGAALTKRKESGTQPRFEVFAGEVEAIDFSASVTNSTQNEVQYYVLSQFGEVLQTQNLTLSSIGEAAFQFTPTAEEGYIVVLRLDEGAAVELHSSYVTSSTATYHCHSLTGPFADCPDGTAAFSGFSSGEVFAVEVSMFGDVNGGDEGPTFTDGTTSQQLGLFNSGNQCRTSFEDAGVLFLTADGTGTGHVSWTVDDSVNICEPRIVMNLKPSSINQLVFPGASSVSDVSTPTQCPDGSCRAGTLVFESSLKPSEITNMTILVQGFAGDRLTLSFGNEVFYNESVADSCSTELQTLQVPVGTGLSGAKFPASVDYSIAGAVNCTERVGLVVGALAFGIDTSGSNVDDTALAAGLGTFAALAVVCALALLYYRSARKPETSAAEVSAKTT